MSDYDELARFLDTSQIKEIKDSLKKRDQGMAPLLAQRSKRQYEPPRRKDRKQVTAKRRKAAPRQQKTNRRTDNNQIQQFVNQAKKLLK